MLEQHIVTRQAFLSEDIFNFRKREASRRLNVVNVLSLNSACSRNNSTLESIIPYVLKERSTLIAAARGQSPDEPHSEETIFLPVGTPHSN